VKAIVIMMICFFTLSACGGEEGATKAKEKDELQNEILLKLNSGSRSRSNANDNKGTD
jgi:hypothetical protein